jgi:mannan endo-1,6-alpha-mannosidase
MAAMEVFQSLLVSDNSSSKLPLSASTGGTSKGNVNAGTNDADLSSQNIVKPSTTGDKAGAGILTTICLGSLFGLTFWLIKE